MIWGPDLTPYAAAGVDPIPLDDLPADYDLSTDEGRTALRRVLGFELPAEPALPELLHG